MSSQIAVTRRDDLFGRTVLKATKPEQFNAKTIGEIMNNVLPMLDKNSSDTQYLYDIYRGKQPVLSRKKTTREDINNKVVENRAYEIVEFKVGYEFSHPALYINASDSENPPIGILNTYSRVDRKFKKDISLARWAYISGTSYRLTTVNGKDDIDGAPYKTVTLDPRSAFVIYSTDADSERILAGTRVTRKILNENGQEKTQWIYGVYSEEGFYTWLFDDEGTSVDFVNTAPTREENTLRLIPIVEYPNNDARLGYIELVLTQLNAINETESNRVDAVAQFVQAYLVFLGCALQKDDDGNLVIPMRDGIIQLPGKEGTSTPDVKFITASLDQNHVHVLKDDTLASISDIVGMPDRNQAAAGGDTGQAVVLRNGWGLAEARAKTFEKMFKDSEMETLKIILKICRGNRLSRKKIGDITLHDIDIQFTRNRNDNMLTKANTLKILLDIGMEPEEALKTCDLVSDPSVVAQGIKLYREILLERAERQTSEETNAVGVVTPPDEVISTVG